MSKFSLYSDSPKTKFESHLEKLKEPARASMIDLRNFIKSLGHNIIEEVRPHRVVYSKTFTFRTFLDIQPANDSLIISIRTGRNKPSTTYTIKTLQDIESIKKQIVDAYEKVQ
jgi:hypothetical protein